MKEEIEFEKIGKNIPYEVPEGFFENISQRTLQEIKQRELRKKKVWFLTRIGAIAASLALLVSIAFFLSRQGIDKDKEELTDQKRVESPQKQEIPGKAPVDKKIMVGKAVPEKSAPIIDQNEEIDDILPDLSEEDLLQMAALYKADPFNE
jgi:hypothetical protein